MQRSNHETLHLEWEKLEVRPVRVPQWWGNGAIWDAVFEVVGSKAYIISVGLSVNGVHQCIGVFDLVSEQLDFIDIETPQAREAMGFAGFVVDDALYLHGGLNDHLAHPHGQMLRLDLVELEWSKFESHGEARHARAFHCAEFVEGIRAVVVFGGWDSGRAAGESILNDVCVWSPDDNKWSAPVIKGSAPTPRSSSASCVVGNNVFFYGGAVESVTSADAICVLHCQYPVYHWSKVSVDLELQRVFATLCYVDGRLIAFGGSDAQAKPTSDLLVCKLPTSRLVFRQVDAQPRATPTRRHSAIVSSNKMYVIGGMKDEMQVLHL